jgi:hypothetical protein
MALDAETINNAVIWTFGGAGGVVGAAFAFRKAFGQWIGIGADTKAVEAGSKVLEAGANANVAGGMAISAVYETLTKEINRLAEVNAGMSIALKALHEEVAALRKENLDLRDEVTKLNDQLTRITSLYASCDTCPANERKKKTTVTSERRNGNLSSQTP